MAKPLLERIETLPKRYAQEKEILSMLASSHKTKAQLRKACQKQLDHYDAELAKEHRGSERLTLQLQSCKKIMRNCITRVLPRL